MASVPIFRQLLPFEWRGIVFPVTTMSIQLQQDLAQHKPYNRDGAIVEGTGRDSLVFTANIPFRNSVAPAPTERFGTLYPDAWRAFIQAMADKSTDTLIHPELGPVRCKPQRVDSNWDATKRDGVDVQATWIETTEDGDQLQLALEAPSPVTDAGVAAQSLDGAIRLSAEQLPSTPTYEPTLTDAMRDLQGIGDSLSLSANRLSGKVDALQYRVGAIGDAFERGGDPRNFAALQTVSRLKEALRSIGEGVTTRSVHFYRVPKDSTFAGVAAQLNKKLTELMALNPRLLSSPIIPANTAVRYNP